MNALLELRQQRAKVIADIGAITEKAAAEKRAMSADENVTFDRLADEEKNLRESIAKVERSDELRKELEQDREQRNKDRRDNPEKRQPEVAYERAFDAYVRRGIDGLNLEERELISTNFRSEFRDQGIGTTAAGGATVPQAFSGELAKAMKFFGGMRESAREISTTTGATLPWPSVNDTGNVGAILGENTADTSLDATFASVNIGAYMYTSKIVKVSRQLLQDSAFDLNAFLRDVLAERVGRITNTHFTVGTGTSQPRGVVIDAPVGKTGATGQTASITYADLVDLKYSVNRAYRPNAVWMMADSTWQVILKLVDLQGRPLINPAQESIANDHSEMLLGQRVVINDDIAAMAANAKSVLYGDFRNYIIRNVQDMILVRMDERFADALQVGFILFYRGDGRLVNPGTNPIKHYANSAT